MLDQTSQQPLSADAPPASSGCTELPSLQRHWTLSCPAPPARRSPLCRLQNQTAARPIRRRCLPDTGGSGGYFFVLLRAFHLFQGHGMHHAALHELQAQLVQSAAVGALRAACPTALEHDRQFLKGFLLRHGADPPEGHADGVPSLQ